METKYVYARLASDISTQQSLFTGKYTGVTSITLQLMEPAIGTANLAIFENDEEKVSQRVTAGGSVSWSPAAGSEVEFYVNYYDGNDMPQVYVTVS